MHRLNRRSMALVLGLALCVVGCRNQGFPELERRAAPALPTATNAWLDGKAFRLADAQGKVILVEAWHPS
jgi:hypothetical protein